jgi:hypothetical protein
VDSGLNREPGSLTGKAHELGRILFQLSPLTPEDGPQECSARRKKAQGESSWASRRRKLTALRFWHSYAYAATATLWKVDVTVSNVCTLGAPSINRSIVFNTCGYALVL